jgi:GNAT superfamily N-acetyltransferase
MKLSELIFAATAMPDKDLGDQSWFDGKAIAKVEGDYTLFRKEQTFYLRSAEDKLAGYIELDGHIVKTIYVLPGFRKLGLGLVLMQAAKQHLGKVVFADVVSPDGAALIDRMVRYPQLFNLSIELRGKIMPYDPVIIRKTEARLVVEGKIGGDPLAGLSWPGVPGNTDPLVRDGIVWFSEELA